MRFAKGVNVRQMEPGTIVALVAVHWAWKDLFMNTIPMTITAAGADWFELAILGAQRDVLAQSIERRKPLDVALKQTQRGLRVEML